MFWYGRMGALATLRSRVAASGSIPGSPYLLSAIFCSASYGLLAGIGDVDFGSRLQAEFLTPFYTKFQIQEFKSTAIWLVAHASTRSSQIPLP
jgi:hypothetical protein